MVSQVYRATDVEAALAAGIFHRHEVEIADVKAHLKVRYHASTEGSTRVAVRALVSSLSHQEAWLTRTRTRVLAREVV